MEVILLKRVHKLGDLGDVAKVKAGYARNYLIPKKLALPATRAARGAFEAQREQWMAAQAQSHQIALERAQTVAALGSLEIKVKAGLEGRLFGAITARDLVLALEEKGLRVDRQELVLPEKYLKQVGSYTIGFNPKHALDGEARSSFVLCLSAEAGFGTTVGRSAGL